MSDSKPFITFERVEVAYNDFVSGLRNVSVSIADGEFVFLCGQTGSGKSTLLKVLSKQVPITKGRVIMAGRDLGTVTEKEVPYLRRQMGIIPQDFGLLPTKKVWENVAYAMRAVGKSRREVRREVPRILERVNILHRADAYPNELSGGEQQRVAIARALINDPPLLLADEPTGNLDPEHSKEILDLLVSLNEKGTTVLVATHDLLSIQNHHKRMLKMSFGQIESDVSVEGEEKEVPHEELEMPPVPTGQKENSDD